jgi:hypothetical protein
MDGSNSAFGAALKYSPAPANDAPVLWLSRTPSGLTLCPRRQRPAQISVTHLMPVSSNQKTNLHLLLSRYCSERHLSEKQAGLALNLTIMPLAL